MKCKCSEVYVIEHGEFKNTKGDFVYLNKPANFRDIYLVWSITGKKRGARCCSDCFIVIINL